MSEPTPIDLAAYHANAVAEIAAFLGNTVDVVAAYPRFEKKMPRRAVAIELDGITPESPDDMGTEQFHGQARFVAQVFIAFTEEDVKLEVRKLAVRLMTWIYGKRFGCKIGPAKITGAQPDELTLPGKTGREGEAEDVECWRVEWTHAAYFGESVWTDEGPQAVEIWTTGPDGVQTKLEA